MVLQRKSLSAAECLSVAAMTVRTLKSKRADDKFALFCKDVTTLADHLVNDYSAATAAAAALPGTIYMKMETPLLNSHLKPLTSWQCL